MNPDNLVVWICLALSLIIGALVICTLCQQQRPSHVQIQNILNAQMAASSIKPGGAPTDASRGAVGNVTLGASNETEKCFLCSEEVAGQSCRELRCNCRVVAHVDCLESWWEQTAPSRPEREVKSGVLQLECPKCGRSQRIPRKFEDWGLQVIKGKKETEWI